MERRNEEHARKGRYRDSRRLKGKNQASDKVWEGWLKTGIYKWKWEK
jgi:hypothetical protein